METPENTTPDHSVPQEPSLMVVAIATSAGGLNALSQIVADLPHDFPAAVVVVQHLSPHYPSYLAAILKQRTALTVKQAQSGDLLKVGHVYIAPPNQHLLVMPDRAIHLTDTARINFSRPAADCLFQSVAKVYGKWAIAIILTGYGHDGAVGIEAIKQHGGITIAQNQATSEQFSMPSAAIDTGAIDYILPLEAIAPHLIQWLQLHPLPS